MTERPKLHVVRTFGKKAEKLRAISDGFRVAADAYRLASDLGCSGDLYTALWDLVEREAASAEVKRAEAERGSHQNH
jgi:hypothetical protein